MIGMLTFQFNDHPIRVALQNNQPWFSAYDLCQCLHLPLEFVEIVDIDCLQTIFVPNNCTQNFDYDQLVQDIDDWIGVVCVNEAGLPKLVTKLTELAALQDHIQKVLSALPQVSDAQRLIANATNRNGQDIAKQQRGADYV